MPNIDKLQYSPLLEITIYPADDERHAYIADDGMFLSGMSLKMLQAEAKDGIFPVYDAYGFMYAVPLALWANHDPAATNVSLRMHVGRKPEILGLLPDPPILVRKAHLYHDNDFRTHQAATTEFHELATGHRLTMRPRTVGTGSRISELRSMLDTTATNITCPLCEVIVNIGRTIEEMLNIFAEALGGDSVIVDLVMSHPVDMLETKPEQLNEPIAAERFWLFEPVCETTTS